MALEFYQHKLTPNSVLVMGSHSGFHEQNEQRLSCVLEKAQKGLSENNFIGLVPTEGPELLCKGTNESNAMLLN